MRYARVAFLTVSIQTTKALKQLEFMKQQLAKVAGHFIQGQALGLTVDALQVARKKLDRGHVARAVESDRQLAFLETRRTAKGRGIDSVELQNLAHGKAPFFNHTSPLAMMSSASPSKR